MTDRHAAMPRGDSSGGREIGPAFSLWLDAMRWAAAWAVLVAHVDDNILIHVSALPADRRSVAHLVFALVAGFGHPAVMVFFVISGFLVGGAHWRAWKAGRAETFRRYMLKRILRLDLVLVPALLLTLVLDLAGKNLLGGVAAGIYLEPQAYSDGLLAFACNLAFLQTIACHEYGTDGALWSLVNEFWYYMLWPPLMAALFFPLKPVLRAGLLVLVVGIALALTRSQFIGAPFAPYMAIWLLGVVAAARDTPFFGPRRLAVVAFLVAAVAARLLFRRGEIEEYSYLAFARDFGLALLFANMLTALKADRSLAAPWGGRLHARLAGFSYSLYCIHTPVLLLFAAAMMRLLGTGWQMAPADLSAWLVVLGAILACLAVGYVFAQATEAHTDRLRRALFGLIDRRADREVAAPTRP